MIEFYPEIRLIHIVSVLLSGSFFALRGAMGLAGFQWPWHSAARWTSWIIDSVLLTAAAMLFSLLPGAVFANGWLTVKLVLVVLYIVLGVFAMRRTAGLRTRGICYMFALAVFATVVSIARAHHPYGWLLPYLG